ncbi:MAG: penicillin-binding transpeptidase domain-containing protein [Peptococcaceae bacterium]|jgi:stage V sporulation protein D (sporulation-specific penicillin-binding protein)|nr:penicillin-binding transpeptidase domain-containing protein [Peptococcaceae bacterium]
MPQTDGGNLMTDGRRKAILLAVPFVLGALLVRLFLIQVLWGGTLGAQALSYRTATEQVPAIRGIIYDRNHNPLVSNEPAGSLYADPKEIGTGLASREAAILAPYLGVKASSLENELSSDRYFVWLGHDLPLSRVDRLKNSLEEAKLPGIYFLPGERRLYLQQDLAAQVLGFTGQGETGLTGLEKSYDRRLAGQAGWLQVQVDREGNPILQTASQVVPPTQGDSLVLTIDENIQFFVEQALDQIVKKYHPASATIIVMDPQTGGILALGNRPTFDPANWQASPAAIWNQDPAVLSTVEPGSLFKIVTASAALEEGLAAPGTRMGFYPGYTIVQGIRLNDAYFLPDENHTLEWAFANSYNPVFARLGVDLGAARFYRYIHGFGFGQPTGIDLPGESDGIMRPEKDATPLRLATMAFGQGISVTPLQMLTAASAVANGGYLMRPRLVRAVVDGSGKTVENLKPVTVRQVISSATSAEVLAMMRRVVENGTGTPAAIPGYSVAGKTGTAQVPGPGGYLPGEYVSSFLGFAPAADPAIGVLIMVNEPRGGQYYGNAVAAPVFSDLGAKILHYLDVPYDLPLTTQPAPAPGGNPPPAAPGLPDLAGYPVSYARRILFQLGLNVNVSGQGQVVAGQHPAAGSPVAAGTAVTLDTRVQNPAAAVTVPNLTGLTIKLAGDVLSGLGLNLQAQGTGVASGQTPAAGARVGPGGTVQVRFIAPPGF